MSFSSFTCIISILKGSIISGLCLLPGKFITQWLVLVDIEYNTSYLQGGIILFFQVYLDFGLAIPKLSVHGMISSVKELLELAPINKASYWS